MSPKLSWGEMYRENAKFGLGAQSINLTSLNIYTDTGTFAKEVDGGGTEGMLLNRSSKRLLSNNSEQ